MAKKTSKTRRSTKVKTTKKPTPTETSSQLSDGARKFLAVGLGASIGATLALWIVEDPETSGEIFSKLLQGIAEAAKREATGSKRKGGKVSSTFPPGFDFDIRPNVGEPVVTPPPPPSAQRKPPMRRKRKVSGKVH